MRCSPLIAHSLGTDCSCFQMNDEISRQIFDELDKQLDQQMMAELEKCHDEHSRQMDEELDRQVK